MKWIYLLYLCITTLCSNPKNDNLLIHQRRPFRLQRMTTSQTLKFLNENSSSTICPINQDIQYITDISKISKK